MEDSPTDTPEIWMSERNEEDTKFEREVTDPIPRRNTRSQFRNSRLFNRGKRLSKIWSGVMYGSTFRLVDVIDKRYQTFLMTHTQRLDVVILKKKSKDEKRKNRPWPRLGGLRSRSQVRGVSETHRSGQVSGQGFQKNTGQVQVSGQGVPDLGPYLWPTRWRPLCLF